MDKATKAKWLKRAEIKNALLDHGREIASLSDSWLNVQAGLPADAVWREENFA